MHVCYLFDGLCVGLLHRDTVMGSQRQIRGERERAREGRTVGRTEGDKEREKPPSAPASRSSSDPPTPPPAQRDGWREAGSKNPERGRAAEKVPCSPPSSEPFCAFASPSRSLSLSRCVCLFLSVSSLPLLLLLLVTHVSLPPPLPLPPSLPDPCPSLPPSPSLPPCRSVCAQQCDGAHERGRRRRASTIMHQRLTERRQREKTQRVPRSNFRKGTGK